VSVLRAGAQATGGARLQSCRLHDFMCRESASPDKSGGTIAVFSASDKSGVDDTAVDDTDGVPEDEELGGAAPVSEDPAVGDELRYSSARLLQRKVHPPRPAPLQAMCSFAIHPPHPRVREIMRQPVWARVVPEFVRGLSRANSHARCVRPIVPGVPRAVGHRGDDWMSAQRLAAQQGRSGARIFAPREEECRCA
jgi:hypothetical protein